MEQQRKRRDALKAKKQAAKAVETKKQSDIAKYGSGSKKGVTRDTSKDKPKRDYTSGGKKGVTRNTSLDTKKPSKPPTRVSKPSKPAPTATPTKSNKERASSRFYSSSSGTYGKPLPINPQLKSQSRKQTGRQKINAEVAANSGGRMTSSGAKSKPQPKRNRRGRPIK